MRAATALFGAIAFLFPATAMAATEFDFMTITGDTSQPIGHFEFCLRHAKECAVKSNPLPVVLTPTLSKELRSVNTLVNGSIVPATDQETYGRLEFWEYPTTEGDCEDFVLLKRRDLIEKGWPVGDLLITVVVQSNGEGHAVLTVVTNQGDLILDNLSPVILPWSETNYRYFKRQSRFDSGTWEAIRDLRPVFTSSAGKH